MQSKRATLWSRFVSHSTVVSLDREYGNQYTALVTLECGHSLPYYFDMYSERPTRRDQFFCMPCYTQYWIDQSNLTVSLIRSGCGL